MRKTAIAVSALALGAVGSGPLQAATVLDYWMWDANQKPGYQMCADAFQAQHPDIKVKIGVTGWNDYWGNLTTAFASGTAPDVFVNHVARFPEFLEHGQVVDLTPFIERDGVDLSIYRKGLVEPWRRDGRQYGLPKDWDTVALVYNKEMLKAAGIEPEELESLTWNPKDGGTFEQVVAKLSIDSEGDRGTSPEFDPESVVQYGIVNVMGADVDGVGQADWSHFAASNGFRFLDGPWTRTYHYDDPRVAETLAWIRGLGEKGLTVPYRLTGKLGGMALFAAGAAAMSFEGSWMITWYMENVPHPFGFAPLPVGPEGRRSMMNGLSDAIWSGSEQKEAAWQWVKFLGSAECQNIIGEQGVLFPAIPEATEKARAKFAERGLDVSAFIEVATPEQTFPYPMTDRGSEIRAIMRSAVQEALSDEESDVAAILKSANQTVNTLLK